MKKVIAFVIIVVCFSATTVMAQGGGQQRTPEERIAALKEQLKPLNMTAVQTDSAVAILMDRSAMANIRDMAPEARQEAMKTWSEARNKRLEKALGAELAKKVIDAMPQRGPGGGRPAGGSSKK